MYTWMDHGVNGVARLTELYYQELLLERPFCLPMILHQELFMNNKSSGGAASSKAFTDRELKVALQALPVLQAKRVRKLAQRLNKRTSIGYYASLDVIARIGDLMGDFPSSRIVISTRTSS